MENSKTLRKFLLIMLTIGIIGVGMGQDADQSTAGGQEEPVNQADKIAKTLANPNAVIGFLLFPMDYISYKGELPGASSQNGFRLSFQPSLPIPIAKGTNIFVRPLVPLVFEQPVFNGTGFENGGTALADIGFDVALGHTWPSKWLTLIGMAGSVPAATNSLVGAGQWALGPEVFVGKNTKWGFFGVLVTQTWGLSSNPNKDLNVTGGQYFYTVNLGNAWQIQAQPTFAINNNASDGNKWSVPLGTGVAKTVLLGQLPVKFSLQYWYYVASPDAIGPEHQVRFSVIPVVNLPWGKGKAK